MAAKSQYRQPNRFFATTPRIPSAKLECAFYVTMLYSLASDVFGISIPLLAGVLVLVVAGVCLLQIHSHAKLVYAPIGLLIACVISFVLVQVLIHDTSLLDGDLRGFIIWILQLIIVQSLCLRQGFSLRYPMFLFVFGLVALPFLTFNPGEVERARVEVDLGIQGGLSHPDGLSEWFGFCAVYLAILGLETDRMSYRVGAWGASVGSLLVVGLTVSRGSIFGAGLAIAVAFRRLLRRGFVPVLLLIILTGGIYESGLFDAAISEYAERGMEETGREILWPAAIERIFSSPLVTLFGVGESKVSTNVLSLRVANPPHNAFLHFALSSGVVPFALFLAFWIQAAWKSVHTKGQEAADSFRLPYVVYALVVLMLGDTAFMAPWALIALSVAAGSAVVYGKQRLLVVRVGNKIRFALFPGNKSPEAGTISRPQS